MKKLLLMGALATGLVATLEAQINFLVDNTASWAGYVNTFAVADDAYLFGFNEGNTSTMSANFNGTGDVLTLSPNARIFDAENGIGDDTDWINETAGTANWYIEASFYQERVGSDANGQLVSFTYEILSDTLPGPGSSATTVVGYTSNSFIKVLDGFSSWATYQTVTGPTTVGSHTIDVLVNDSGITAGGTIVVQVGFAVTGDIQPTLLPDFSANPVLDTGLNIAAVPEPSTYAFLLGFAALGLVIYRRRK